MSSDFIKFPKILILFFLITFGSFLGLLVTPALPLIASDFGVSLSTAGQTMSIFLVGYSMGQLPYGPLANRYGRKQAIAIGAVLAFIGSLIAYMASDFWTLCLGRWIQAMGAGVGLKIGFTMVGDLHAGDAAAKTLATLSTAFGFIPGLATALGGFLTTYGGWRGCFLFLSLYTIAIWFFCQFLPETGKEIHKDALKMKKIAKGFFHQFKDPFVVFHAVLAGLATAVIYIFATISPPLSMNRMGLSPDQFGLWSIIPSLGLFSGALVSRKIASRTRPRILILSGILTTLVSSLVLSLCFANALVDVWSLFIPTYFMYLGVNLIWSNALAHGLSKAIDKSNCSAVMQFINIGVATIAVFLIGVVSPTATMLFPASLAIILSLMFALYFIFGSV